MNPNQIIPHALLFAPPSSTDFIRGSSASILYEVRNSTGDWTQDLPTYEPQRFKFDTNECSQISGVIDCEIQCNFLRRTLRFPPEAMKWFTDNGYIDSNGSFAFSERFTAILAGTSINGNYQWAFWQTIARYGLLPRQDLAYTLEQSQKFVTQVDMCNDYYNSSVITDAMRAKALESLQYLQIQYQWIHSDPSTTTPDAELISALKQSPLQIGTPVCMGTWNTGSVMTCPVTTVGHATTLFSVSAGGLKNIRDHYNPMNKTLSADYMIPLVTQGVISPVPVVIPTFHYTFGTRLSYGDQGPEVKAMQTALSYLGYLEPKYITGNFLDRTSAALLQFQKDKKIMWNVLLDFYQGHYFSLLSIKAMNTIFS